MALDDPYGEIDMAWIRQYLDHEFKDICTFSRLYRKTFSDQPTHSVAWGAFLSSLPPLKYKWEWLNGWTKDQELKTIEDKLETLVSSK